MNKDKKEKLEKKGWKFGNANEFLDDVEIVDPIKEVKEPDPIQELCFVRPSQWIRAYDGLWTRRWQSRQRCAKCGWQVNARKVEVQIVPTDDDWKALGMEGVSISYVPFKGELEIHWCPDCRRVVATALDSDRKGSLYDDQEEGYGKTSKLPLLTHSAAYDKLQKEKDFWYASDMKLSTKYAELHKENEQHIAGLEAATLGSIIAQDSYNELRLFIKGIVDRHDAQLEDRECMCEFCEPARKLLVHLLERKENEDGKGKNTDNDTKEAT